MRAFQFASAPLVAVLGALALLIMGGAAARAEDVLVKAGDITIVKAWTRTTSVKTGVVYLTIRNDGATADRLTGAAADIAAMTHLHVTREENGVSRMRPVDGIDLPPHATVMLRPGGYHVMLMGLSKPLKAGQSFPLVLTFAKAGEVTVTVAVKPAGADGKDSNSMGHMDMDKMDNGSGR